MTYSVDLRKRVVEYVRKGGFKAEASRIFGVSLWCVNDWCRRKNLAPKIHPPRRKRKLDWEALKIHTQTYPDAFLRERAEHFGVHIHAIEYALKEMNLTRKKKPSVRRKKP